MIAFESVAKDQIDRILHSYTLRACHNLRHLLRYLADKSLSGEGSQLKEYSIGVDAFHKDQNYDPRHDSTVRIQAGRLRQKLTEYYAAEGLNDLTIVELPKGCFELKFHPREVSPPASTIAPAPASPPIQTPGIGQSSRATLLVASALILLTAWAVAASLSLWRERRQTAEFRDAWTPELQALWAPFLTSDRPLLISASAPLFIRVPGVGFFRDLSLNRPEEVPGSRLAGALAKALGRVNPEVRYYYTPFDEANVTFMLGKVLATRRSNVSTVKSSELTWQQLSDNNVVFTGAPRLFSEQLSSMPAQQDLIPDPAGGVKNLAPRPGEPAIFKDDVNAEGTDGTTYALVSHTPGPLGVGDVGSFASIRSAGRMAAVQFFTDAQTARLLVAKLRGPSGEVPRYYQVVLKVQFRNGTPVKTTYVLYRELRRQENPSK